MRVLVACHEPGARDALLDGLRRAGFDVIVAPPDGEATLELVRHQRPDVVFLDNEFPGLNGVSGLKRMLAETGGAQSALRAQTRRRSRPPRAAL